MDPRRFDPYASYSDSSAPRTPSPSQPSVMNIGVNFPLKHTVHDEPVRNIFADGHHDDNAVIVHPENVYGWNQPPQVTNFSYNHSNSSRGSLGQELYGDHDAHNSQHLTPEFPHTDTPFVSEAWQQQQHQQQLSSRQHDFSSMRRATFPYVRQDREDFIPPMQQQNSQFLFHTQQPQHQLHPFSTRQDPIYPSEQISLQHPTQQYNPSRTNFDHFEETPNIKLEDNSSMMMSQNFYRQQPSSNLPINMSYLSPHNGLPVQHTDDAASKETQYLRRRCFNCHTTEPPSWRRSTLNPGKIVCNKCGLYERTHLRPRPLRFDELRAGNKARKQKRGLSPKGRVGTAAAAGNAGAPASPSIKKESREFGLVRRSSVSSIASTQSGSGASDWDDNVSLYSSGSAPPTSYNSPAISPYPLSRAESSSPNSGVSGIRLPNAPLTDIHSSGSPQSYASSPALQTNNNAPFPNSPRHTQTSPDSYGVPTSNGEDYFNIRKRTESASSAHSVHSQRDGNVQLILTPAEQAAVSTPALA